FRCSEPSPSGNSVEPNMSSISSPVLLGGGSTTCAGPASRAWPGLASRPTSPTRFSITNPARSRGSQLFTGATSFLLSVGKPLSDGGSTSPLRKRRVRCVAKSEEWRDPARRDSFVLPLIADVSWPALDVRFWGRSRHHLLVLSFSALTHLRH